MVEREGKQGQGLPQRKKSWDLGSPEGRLSIWKHPWEGTVWVSLPSGGWVGSRGAGEVLGGLLEEVCPPCRQGDPGSHEFKAFLGRLWQELAGSEGKELGKARQEDQVDRGQRKPGLNTRPDTAPQQVWNRPIGVGSELARPSAPPPSPTAPF